VPPQGPFQVTLNELHSGSGWAAVFGRRAPLELEIGCGWDPFLLQAAHRRPETDFVGLEYDRQRVREFADRIAQEGLANLRVFHGEAMHALPRLFERAQLQRVYIHFPDPWPKKRHEKNRLLGPRFLKLLFYHLADGAELVVGTDSAEYRDFIAASFREIPEILNPLAPEPWVDRLPGHPQPKIENIFPARGKPIYYFQRVRGPAFAAAHDGEIDALRRKIPRRMDTMPHVVLSGQPDLEALFRDFQPYQWREGDVIFKLTEAWRPARQPGLLLESLIVEEGHDEWFYIELSPKAKGLVVKIAPVREVDRTELLFRFLAGAVRWLQQHQAGLAVARHNLATELE